MHDDSRPDLPLKLLRIAALLSGLMLASVFIWIATKRLVFPDEVKWMEGGMLDQVLHILDGNSIYIEPSWEFGTYLYTPFFYYLSAATSLVTGPNFISMRLVSLVSTAAIAVLIALIVRRESQSVFAAAIAALLYLGAYEVSGYFMDAGRSDSLFLALVLGYVYCARYRLTVSGQVLAALLGTLALLTKQTAIIACVPVALYLFFTQQGRLRFVTPVTGVALALASLGYLQWSSEGWFSYYTLELPGAHRYQWHKFPGLTLNQFLLQYPFALAVSLVAFTLGGAAELRQSRFSLVLFFTLLTAALLPYMHTGSAANVLLPMQAGTAILLGVALSALEGRGNWLRAALVLVSIQFAYLSYNPASALPRDDFSARAQNIVQCMVAMPKPVLNTRTGFLWTRAGKPRSIHEPSAADIFRTEPTPQNAALRAEFVERIEDQYYSAIFFGPQLYTELGGLLDGHYVNAGFTLPMVDPDGSSNAYMAGYVYLSREYLGDQQLTGEPFCTSAGFLAAANSPRAERPLFDSLQPGGEPR